MDSPDIIPTTGPPLPSRPMPPVPGGKPPLLPDKVPNGSLFRPKPQRRTNTTAPVRSAPALPNRPSPVPVHAKPASASHSSASNRNSGGRPRPVITVLDARPMTEVGFRDLPTGAPTAAAPPPPSRPRANPATDMSNGSGASGASPPPDVIPVRPAPPTRPPSFRRSMPPTGEGGAVSPSYDPDQPLPVPPRPNTAVKNNALSMLANVIAPKQHKPADNQDLLDTASDKDSGAFGNDGFENASVSSDKSSSHADYPADHLMDAPAPSAAQSALVDFNSENQNHKPGNDSMECTPINWGGSSVENPAEDSFDVNYTENSLPASASTQPSVSDKVTIDTMNRDSDFDYEQVREEPESASVHSKMGGIAVLPADLLGAALANRRRGDDDGSDKVSPRASPPTSRRPYSYAAPDTTHVSYGDYSSIDSGVAKETGKQPPPPPSKPKKSFLAELHKSLGKPPPGSEPPETGGNDVPSAGEDIYAVPHKNRNSELPATQPSIPRSATFPVERPETKGKPPPPIKPKPSLMPKPGLKPKPSFKSKPPTPVVPKPVDTKPEMRAKSTEPEKSQTETTSKSYNYSSGRNRMSDMIKNLEEQSSSGGSSEPPKFGFGSLKPRAPTKSESSEDSQQKESSPETSTQVTATKRPGPMKATYRPTIIRPSASAPEREEENPDPEPIPAPAPLAPAARSLSVSNLSQRFSQAAEPEKSDKPASVVPRRKPTIIRAGSRNSMIQSSAASPEEPVSASNPAQPRPKPRSMMSAAFSMPNIAKAADQDFSVVGIDTETSDNSSNERRESTGAPPPRPVPRRQTPPASPTFNRSSDPVAAKNRVQQAIVQPNVLSELRRNFDEPEMPFPLADPPRGSEPRKLGPAKPPPPKAGPARPATPPAMRKSSGTSDSKAQKPPRPSSGPPPRPASGPKLSPSPTARKQHSAGSSPNLPNRPGPGHPLFHYVVSGPHGIALFDYNTGEAGDLSFKAGDTIVLVEEVDAEWLRGRISNREGMFPSNFIDIVEPLPMKSASSAPIKPVRSPTPDVIKTDLGHGPRCLARFDYEAEENDDLRFRAGDVIKLLEHVGGDWLKGELMGRTGMFPASFVEIIEDLPQTGAVTETDGPSGMIQETCNVVNALHDFNGEPDELSFMAGEKITVLSKLDNIWLYGQIGPRKGTFPSNFIDRMPDGLPDYVKESTPPPAANPSSSASGAYCVALYTFPGEADGDLPFQEGDKITLLERVDADWLKGSVHGRTGMFPAGFVDVVKDVDSSDSLPARPSSSAKVTQPVPSGLALYDYDSEAADDLSFRTGDTIELVEQMDSNWMKGRLHGKVGMFPASFVEVVVPL